METFDHRLNADLLGERVGEDVAGGDLDKLLPQAVLRHVLICEALPRIEDLLRGGGRVEVKVCVFHNVSQ
jgi:hypothetical protein